MRPIHTSASRLATLLAAGFLAGTGAMAAEIPSSLITPDKVETPDRHARV